MAQQQVGIVVGIDIGDIGDVAPGPFEVSHHLQLPAHEILGTIGPVERDDAGRGSRDIEPVVRRGNVGIERSVEILATPLVVGLPGRHAGLHQDRRGAGVVPDGERDQRLVAVSANQLDDVVTAGPGRRHVEGVGGRPVCFDQVVGRGANGWKWFHDALQGPDRGRRRSRRRHQATPQPSVPAQAIDQHVVGHRGANRDHEGDLPTERDTDPRGIALDFAMLGEDRVRR